MNASDREKTCLPLLNEIPMLRDLAEEPRRFIAGGCWLRTASKGLVLCEKDSVPNGFFYLIKGRVKLAILSEEGGERVVDIVLPGRTFAEASAFLDEPCPVYAEALGESLLLFLDRDRIRDAAGRWPAVGLALLVGVARRVNQLTRDLEACCLHSASRRVGTFLLQHAQSRDGEPDQAEVVLPAAKVVVASSLNLTAETFSRELHSLARDTVIDIDRRTIRIRSLDLLRRRCEAHCRG